MLKNLMEQLEEKIHAFKQEELPVAINYLKIADGKFPNFSIMSRGKLAGKYNTTIPSFQVKYEDGSVIIDVPFSKELFDKFKSGEKFYDVNFDLMQKAMLESDKIIVTHEHWDHVGGIAKSPNYENIIGKVMLTKEQINSPYIKDSGFPDDFQQKINSIEYDSLYELSPGIILIKAPGHTPGHQIICIQLQNGNSYFLLGDIIWSRKNLEKKRSRPWFVSRFILKEDMNQLSNQIKWICSNIYNKEDQKIYTIISHDIESINKMVNDKLVGNSFD